MKKQILFSLLSLSVSIFAVDKIEINHLKSWSHGNSIKVEQTPQKSFVISGRGIAMSQILIDIDLNAKYKLSGEIRTAPNKTATVFYLGLVSLDEKKRQILPENFNIVSNTTTQLISDVLPNDKVIKVKDGSKWRKGKLYNVAFNVDNSKDLKDLPNYNISKSFVKNITPKNNFYEIEFANHVGIFATQNSYVRQHQSSSNHIYVLAWKTSTSNWNKFSGEISGVCQSKISTKNFRPKTQKGRIVIILNAKNQTNCAIEYRNLKLEKVK